MVSINIKNREKTPGGWIFLVDLTEENQQDLEFRVELDEDYYNDLTNLSITPEELIKRSFQFLLKRETKHAILKDFNLRQVEKFFPDFESLVKVT